MLQPSINLAKAVAVTAELTGTVLSEAAIQVLLADLARYPESQVMGALTRCRRELKGRMSPGDIISRLDDGRPGVEEAWAMVPKGEAESVVWTEEMARAMSSIHDLLDSGDAVAARMAFKEVYQRLCQDARDKGIPVAWSLSLGWDMHSRSAPHRQHAGLVRPGQVRDHGDNGGNDEGEHAIAHRIREAGAVGAFIALQIGRHGALVGLVVVEVAHDISPGRRRGASRGSWL